MRIRYDTGADVLYIRLREGTVEESDEVSEGMIVDYDSEGRPLGIELLDASEVLGGKEMRVELALIQQTPATT